MNRTFWKQLWVLLIYAFAGLLVTLAFSVVAMSLVKNYVASLYVVQWLQTIFVMIIPAALWCKWSLKGPVLETFGFDKINWRFMFLTFILMVVSIPAFEFLSVASYQIPLPESVREFCQSQTDAEMVATKQLLSPEGVLGFISIVLLVSVGTAFGEETMFRGALYSVFRKTEFSKHTIAICVGFIFSLIHFDIFGFCERWLLGTIFCYLVIWSGSIWPAILAHAMNNLVAIIQYKLMGPEALDMPDDFSRFSNPDYMLIAVSFIVSIYMIYRIYNESTASRFRTASINK